MKNWPSFSVACRAVCEQLDCCVRGMASRGNVFVCQHMCGRIG